MVGVYRDVGDGSYESSILVLSVEYSIVFHDLFDGSEISDVDLALMNPEVVRLDISVDVPG